MSRIVQYVLIYHAKHIYMFQYIANVYMHHSEYPVCLQVSHIDCVSREEAHDFVEDDQQHA